MRSGYWIPRSPYSSHGQPPSTVAQWLALLRIDPSNLDIRLQLAGALADEGFFDAALGQYNICLGQCPKTTDIRRSKRLLVVVRMKRTLLRRRSAGT